MTTLVAFIGYYRALHVLWQLIRFWYGNVFLNSPFWSNRHVWMGSVQTWKCQKCCKMITKVANIWDIRLTDFWSMCPVQEKKKHKKNRKAFLYASWSTWQYKDSTNSTKSTISFKDCHCKFAQWIDLKMLKK